MAHIPFYFSAFKSSTARLCLPRGSAIAPLSLVEWVKDDDPGLCRRFVCSYKWFPKLNKKPRSLIFPLFRTGWMEECLLCVFLDHMPTRPVNGGVRDGQGCLFPQEELPCLWCLSLWEHEKFPHLLLVTNQDYTVKQKRVLKNPELSRSLHWKNILGGGGQRRQLKAGTGSPIVSLSRLFYIYFKFYFKYIKDEYLIN